MAKTKFNDFLGGFFVPNNFLAGPSSTYSYWKLFFRLVFPTWTKLYQKKDTAILSEFAPVGI